MKLKSLLLSVSFMFGVSVAQAEEPLKVGFVYIGSIGDNGWTYAHNEGRQEMKKYFKGKIRTTFVENVAEGADAERVITQLAKAGNKVIFTTSFGYMDATLKVAERFPNVVFEHATGYKRTKNVGTYALRTYEGRYISGVAAGLLTKSNTIGYIGTFPIAEVIRDIDATYMGAKSVNPNIKLKIVWTNTWYDQSKETNAANTLMDQGADVLIQHTDSNAPLIATQKRGVKAIGQGTDQSHFAPVSHLFSVRHHWAPFYINTVQQVMNGTWTSQNLWSGFRDNLLQLVSFNPTLSKDVRAKIEETLADIKSGKIKIFTGPIKDNTGEVAVPEGHSLSDEELTKINWYVQGITDEIPH